MDLTQGSSSISREVLGEFSSQIQVLTMTTHSTNKMPLQKDFCCCGRVAAQDPLWTTLTRSSNKTITGGHHKTWPTQHCKVTGRKPKQKNPSGQIYASLGGCQKSKSHQSLQESFGCWKKLQSQGHRAQHEPWKNLKGYNHLRLSVM